MKYLLISLFLSLSITRAQQPTQYKTKIPIMDMCGDQDAQYPGGMRAFFSQIYDHISYPKFAKQHKIEGTFYLEFIINEYGKLVEPALINGPGYGIDDMVYSAIHKLNDWIPADIGNETTAQKFILPFIFKLD